MYNRKHIVVIGVVTAVARGGLLSDTRLRINEQIRVREVRLIGSEGEQLGVISTVQALQMARVADLDLVEVASHANPPVCKILDYGKYRFELEKKLREAKKKQRVVKLKEVRMQPKIADGDIETKSKQIRGFLEEGSKVKVTIRFRGRELAHPEIGEEVLQEILKHLEGSFGMEKPAAMEGRFMSMTLAPKTKK